MSAAIEQVHRVPGEIIGTNELKAALTAAKEQANVLGLFIRDVMVEGIDYGTIPGTERKLPDGSMGPNRTLLKPGAEKLLSLFRCHPEFTLESIEDWDKGLFVYRFKCRILTAAGDVVAEGFGSASSRESKYRWRTSQRVCPKCQQPNIRASKDGGFYCWAKTAGCGAKFGEHDKSITDQKLGRVENPDAADVANTVLKMAKKRSLVDAALATARCSDLFGQDLEDLVELDVKPQAPAKPPAAAAPAKPPASKPNGHTPDGEAFNQDTGELDPLEATADEKAETEEGVLLELIAAAANQAMLKALTARCNALKPAARQEKVKAQFRARWNALGTTRAVGEEG